MDWIFVPFLTLVVHSLQHKKFSSIVSLIFSPMIFLIFIFFNFCLAIFKFRWASFCYCFSYFIFIFWFSASCKISQLYLPILLMILFQLQYFNLQPLFFVLECPLLLNSVFLTMKAKILFYHCGYYRNFFFFKFSSTHPSVSIQVPFLYLFPLSYFIWIVFLNCLMLPGSSFISECVRPWKVFSVSDPGLMD